MMHRIFVFIFIYFLFSCSEYLCGNELINETPSPNGKYTASVFERNCGATTPFIRVVSLRLSGAKFNPEETENWVFIIHAQADIRALWINDKLKITYSGGYQDQPTKLKKWREVIIFYE